MTGRPCRYAFSVLRGDYIRTGFGLVLAGGPLLTVAESGIAALILTILVGLFAGFDLRTALRHLSVFELDDRSLVRRGAGGGRLGRSRLDWNDLTAVKLSFYSTRRDRSQGWMYLRLRAGRIRLGVESTLDGFDDIVAQAARAARQRKLELSSSTVGNFQALGIDLDAGDASHGASR